jgi:hypothetical protein
MLSLGIVNFMTADVWSVPVSDFAFSLTVSPSATTPPIGWGDYGFNLPINESCVGNGSCNVDFVSLLSRGWNLEVRYEDIVVVNLIRLQVYISDQQVFEEMSCN